MTLKIILLSIAVLVELIAIGMGIAAFVLRRQSIRLWEQWYELQKRREKLQERIKELSDRNNDCDNGNDNRNDSGN